MCVRVYVCVYVCEGVCVHMCTCVRVCVFFMISYPSESAIAFSSPSQLSLICFCIYSSLKPLFSHSFILIFTSNLFPGEIKGKLSDAPRKC